MTLDRRNPGRTFGKSGKSAITPRFSTIRKALRGSPSTATKSSVRKAEQDEIGLDPGVFAAHIRCAAVVHRLPPKLPRARRRVSSVWRATSSRITPTVPQKMPAVSDETVPRPQVGGGWCGSN